MIMVNLEALPVPGAEDGIQRVQPGDQAAVRPRDSLAPAQPGERAGRLVPMVLSGVVGAVTVTLLNETVRRLVPHAPRMEVMGERGVRLAVRVAGRRPPKGRALYRWTMAGDVLSNSLYYSLVGTGSRGGAWPRGAVLGLAAGGGAAVLPQQLGFGHQPGARTPVTEILTAGWYLAGGLAAAATYRRLRSNS
jgi:hypothetical protein